MSSDRDSRAADSVRTFLSTLADSAGNSVDGRRSIDGVASELRLDAEDLRRFRDGYNAALAPTSVTLFAKMLGRGDVSLGMEADDSLTYADPASTGGQWDKVGQLMAQAEGMRQEKLRLFHQIDRHRPEAHQGLSAYADLGVTGNVGEDARHAGGFEPLMIDGTAAAKAELARAGANINGNVFPDDDKWQAFRGMMKFGDQYGECLIGRRRGRLELTGMEPRHARTMRVHRTDDGRRDPRKAYVQVRAGVPEPVASFPAWKVAHFANRIGWGDAYGESLFECLLRSYVQIEGLETAMMVRRFEHASRRLVHDVDIGEVDGGDQSVLNYIEKVKKANTKKRTVDNSRNFALQRIAHPPEADIYVPKRTKDSPAGVRALEGDGNIGEIADFQHFFNKYLAGLGVPKGHLGYEDEGSKSGVNDKHVVFGRRVRGCQMKFIGTGLNHLYWLSLMLRSIDPRTVRYAIFPPALGVRDELIRAQVQLAHSTTVMNLAKSFSLTGKVPSIAWFCTYVMGFDEDVLKDLDLKEVVQDAAQGAGLKNAPAGGSPKESAAEQREMAVAALAHDEVREQVNVMRYLLEERELQRRPAWLADRYAKHTCKNPFRAEVADVARMLGIKELRAA